MTSETADPRPINDQGQAPTHPQPTGPSMKAEALRLAINQDLPVLPLHSIRDGICTCSKGQNCGSAGKHPRMRDWVKNATTDTKTIALWWTRWPDANIGIATGKVSSLFVLDVDPRHGGDDSLDALIDEHGHLSDTVEVLTGGDGRHVYFAHDGVEGIGNSSSKLGPGLDIKTDGGFVVAPPSLHVSGQRYEWEASSHPNDTELAPPPHWMVNVLNEGTNSSQESGDNREGNGRTNDSSVVLAGVPEGARNDTLFRYACWLRGQGRDLSEATVLVREAASNCEPPLPLGEVNGLLQSAYSYDAPDDLVGDGTAASRLLIVRSVADWFEDPPKPVDPIVTGLLLPGDQVVIGGARGAAKTWLLMATALQLARGEGLVLGRFSVARSVKVLYCHGELPDDHSTFARWELLTAGGTIPDTLLETYSRIRIRIVREREQVVDDTTGRMVTRERARAVIDPEFIEYLRDTSPDVVSLDPWAVFYTGQEIDNTQIEAAVSALTDLTDELGITWDIAHHFSQGRQGADPEDWWRGASRLADWASVRITLQPAYTEKQAREQGMTRMEARRFANVRLLLRRQETPPDFGARFDAATGLWVPWDSPTLTDQRRSGLTVDDVVKALWAAGGEWASTNAAGKALGVAHSTARGVLEDAQRAGMIVAFDGPRRATGWKLKEMS